jgi:beta-lactamase superfamily II metal-dependent hydrolase
MGNVASGTPRKPFAPGCLLGLLAVASCGFAAPPNVPGISRTQSRIPASILTQHRLRIWFIDVGQGDAILIELPESVSIALGNPSGDPVNLLVDGGASPVNLARKTPEFLHRLYGAQRATIEHMVLTHHDRDHVVGLTRVLEDQTIAVANIYVSGLAAFRRGVRDIPLTGNAGGFVGDKNRSLGRFTSTGMLESRYLVDTFGVLKARVAAGELTSDYGDFAAAIVAKTMPAKVRSFQQACFGCGALDALRAPKSGARPAFSLTTIWPMKRPRGYSQWDKTTNGNSIAFRVDYGGFSMLFTGDLNTQSEPEVIANLEDEQRTSLLDVDVFKAAHHGSDHNAPEFLDHERLKPVLSVASMGGAGFMAYGHPSLDTIATLGGAKRFYSTYVREIAFDRAKLTTPEKIQKVVEDTHVLIETDGERFRIVEVGTKHDSPVFDVNDVPADKGTPWISAN